MREEIKFDQGCKANCRDAKAGAARPGSVVNECFFVERDCAVRIQIFLSVQSPHS